MKPSECAGEVSERYILGFRTAERIRLSLGFSRAQARSRSVARQLLFYMPSVVNVRKGKREV
jgi:hypothetical protein